MQNAGDWGMWSGGGSSGVACSAGALSVLVYVLPCVGTGLNTSQVLSDGVWGQRISVRAQRWQVG